MKSVIKRDGNPFKTIKYKQLIQNEDKTDDCFQDSDNENANEDSNHFQLKNRQHVKNKTECEPLIEYINYEVKADESLRAIALRYGCSVSAIKRINNLITDHEFYGLRVIKLPVKKFGILSDVLVHQINSHSNSDELQLLSEHNLNHNPRQRTDSLTVNIGISQHLSQTSGENGFRFLSHLDEDLKKIRETTKTVIESSNIKFLDQNLNPNEMDLQTIGLSKRQKRSAFACDESDYGINWCNLLLLAFVLCFLLPLVYVLYVSESHNNSNSSDHHFHNHSYV